MKHNLILFLAALALIAQACGPSPAQLTATAEQAVAQTQTAAPTRTSTPTETPSPTATATPEPTATFAPGTGRLEIHASLADSGEPVVGLQIINGPSATILVGEPDFEGFTDANGLALITDLSPGTYWVQPVWILEQTASISCRLGEYEFPKLEGDNPADNLIFGPPMSFVYLGGAGVIVQVGQTTTLDLAFICE